MSFARELETARSAALEAATLVRSFVGRPIKVDRKAGDEPVTEADRAANDLILSRVRAAFPDDTVLSEEIPHDGARLDVGRVWMIDPIDGTRDFIHGEPGYAVMIGLCVDGRPRVGVVAEPATGKTYLGVADGEAWSERPDGSRVRLRTSSCAAGPGIRLVSSKSHRTEEIDRFRQVIGVADEVSVGGVGVKIGLVAEASRDLYVYPGSRTKLWDTCAPEAILIGAGGRLTDIEGKLLAYSADQLHHTRGLLASNGLLHDEAVRAFTEVRRDSAGRPHAG